MSAPFDRAVKALIKIGEMSLAIRRSMEGASEAPKVGLLKVDMPPEFWAHIKELHAAWDECSKSESSSITYLVSGAFAVAMGCREDPTQDAIAADLAYEARKK